MIIVRVELSRLWESYRNIWWLTRYGRRHNHRTCSVMGHCKVIIESIVEQINRPILVFGIYADKDWTDHYNGEDWF